MVLNIHLNSYKKIKYFKKNYYKILFYIILENIKIVKNNNFKTYKNNILKI